jgi:phospholipid/cholesterol/gamma-HCH transport system permease protein
VSELARLGALMVLLFRTLKAALGGGVSFREVLRQVDETASRSAPLVGFAMAFFGAVIVTIAHAQSKKFVGNVELAGPPYFELMVREFGPLAACILAAARYGASNSAELSAMAVNEQIEALVLSAGDPLTDLVAPRVLGGLIGFPLLAVLGTATAALAAAGFGQAIFGFDGSAFLDARFVRMSDLVCGLGKAFVCGAFVPLVTAYEGLSCRGGAAAVGERTTRGVVAAVLGCLVIDFVFAVGFRLVRL